MKVYDDATGEYLGMVYQGPHPYGTDARAWFAEDRDGVRTFGYWCRAEAVESLRRAVAA